MAYAYCDFSAFHSVFANLFSGFGDLSNLIPSSITDTSNIENSVNFKIEDGKVVQVQSSRPRVGISLENIENGWSFLSLGRLSSRISGYFYSDFVSNYTCIHLNWLKIWDESVSNEDQNAASRDFGECSGQLFSVMFDASLN